jgi:Alpha-L-arabinofuranosidase B, catalytic
VRILFLLVGLLLALVALGAQAAMKAGPNMAGPGHHRLRAAAGGAPPLDGLATPTGAYSFRKLRSAYAGNAVRLRRASDNAELDIGFLGATGFTGAPWNEAAATSHCAATTCFIKTRYDQSGAAKDLVQASAAAQPPLIFNCKGVLPCWRIASSATLSWATSTTTPATGVVSISVVANRDSGTGSCFWLRQNVNNNRLQATSAVANQWVLFGGTGGTITAVVTDGAWHAAQAVVNAAASGLTVDGTTTTGTVTGNVAAGVTGILGSTTSVCSGAEEIIWDNVALTAGEIAALTANQRSYWGTP